MGKFLTELDVKDIGGGKFQLLSPLIYESTTIGLIIVPTGFITDFASVPRLPLVFLIFGGLGRKEAVLHDWLYTPPHVPHLGCAVIVDRATADKVLRGARYACDKLDFVEYDQVTIAGVLNNVWAYIGAWCTWVGVRSFGWRHWRDA